MIGMSTILSIKRRCNDGDSVAQIAREEGISEPTVRKYRDMDDFSPCVKAPKRRAGKLDPFKPIVDAWLAEDARRRPKQRHTARRAYDRLAAECGYDGGYTTVQKYVKARKAEIRSVKGEFLNLEWAPGEAQVDFGACDFRVLGVVREVHCLVATFPFSNVSLAQCFWGEASECVREGLKAVFVLCGGVPTRLAFDNAPASAGARARRSGRRTPSCALPPATVSRSPSAAPTPATRRGPWKTPRAPSAAARSRRCRASTASLPTANASSRSAWSGPARTTA